MSHKLTALVLTLASCGPGQVGWQYQAECLIVKSELRLNTEVLGANVVQARELMTPLVGDFCEEFDGTHVQVLDTDRWTSLGESVCGTYEIVGGITIGRRGVCLVHELFHAYDAHRGILNSYRHVDWDTNGRDELDYYYNVRINKNLVAKEQ